MDPLSKPVYVTQPAMPPFEEFSDYLRKIWDNKILTNNGPFHEQFEKELAAYLGVEYLTLFANGTLALVTALQALHITGEVITTPFSFVATTHSLWWNNIKPVFADIEKDFFNLDPDATEAAITPQTTAIMPVHVYGNPCMLDRFQQLADTYGLKLIYDAAHAFGVTVKGNSILNFGDLSILSFHATKSFTTIEGGAIVCHDEKTKHRIDFLKNFGFENETSVIEPGINAKMNELQSAFGIVQLKHVDQYLRKRKSVADLYRQELAEIKGIRFLNDIEGVRHSYTYFPILVDALDYGKTRNNVYDGLKKYNIISRRYFYPLISQFPTYRGLYSARKGSLPVAESVTEQVLCLPLFPDLESNTVLGICDLLRTQDF